jgi:hypothetical protein
MTIQITTAPGAVKPRGIVWIKGRPGIAIRATGTTAHIQPIPRLTVSAVRLVNLVLDRFSRPSDRKAV